MVKSPVPICRSALFGILMPDVDEAVNRILPPTAAGAAARGGGRPTADVPAILARNGIRFI